MTKPRKRARSETVRIHSWTASKDVKPLGFAGYKAGMTHVMAVDNRKHSKTAGLEICIPVTVIDSPPMLVLAIRAYQKAYLGKAALTDVLASDLKEDIKKRLSIPKTIDTSKGLKNLDENIENISDIRLIVLTQPTMTSMAKKTPDAMEIALGGTVSEKLEYAKKVLGKEISADDVLTKSKCIDVSAVTKGKGFEGIVTRLGTRIQPRKTDKGRRHGGSGGPWTPARKMWQWPLPGQFGYHTRTEFNKIVMSVGKEGKDVSPSGGFVNYGPVKGQYVLLYGSVPGPTKRLIRISPARRPLPDANFEITSINTSSKQGV